MIFDDVVRERRSVRDFLPRAVEDKKIREIIECARISPSAKNRQPWFFSVLKEHTKEEFSELLMERAEANNDNMAKATARIIAEASVLILVFSGKACPNPYITDILSIGGAMYAMCLKATDLGLGSLWIGDTDLIADDIDRATDNGKLLGAVAIGYTSQSYPARPRKGFAEITDFDNSILSAEIHDDITEVNLDDARYAFISYSHANGSVVVSDAVELQKHNIPIWYDKSISVGDKWDEHALSVLRAPNCRAVLLYISAESVTSEPVYREFSAAIEKRREDPDFLIIPIHIGGALLTDIVSESERRYGKGYGNAYLDYFGRENRVIYIPRDTFCSSFKHLEKAIDSLMDVGVVTNGRVYESFAYKIADGEYAVIEKYIGSSKAVKIPEMISGYPVRAIGDGAFADNKAITECVIPHGVVRIGLGAFRGCEKLCSVDIPTTATDIGVAAFRDCSALSHIKLPKGMTVLREALFRGCTSLVTITVPEGVVELEEAVFRHCRSLESAYLPSTLRRMTEGGFYDCISLVELVIPEDTEGLEIGSFDTSVKLRRTVVGGFVFEAGKGTPIVTD